MHRRFVFASFLAATAFLLAGCPKRQGNAEFKAGKQAELNQDYDTALIHYDRALRSDPTNAEYKLRATQMRFQAGQFHVEQGKKALAKGDLQLALGEFQKAQAIDPSNDAAEQQTKRTMELIAAQRAAESPVPARPPETELLSAPPELKPLSREPINLKMTNEARIVFDTVAKLAGLTVIFDPDFQSRRISIELPNVTLEQALDAVAIESKAFWKPVTSNIILVAPDQPQKRRDFEDQVVRTFYLSNTLTPQDLTEIVTGLRQLLDLKRVQQVNSQNAIVVRDTPDKLVLAGKIIHDIDRAKPEVLIQVQVLEASLDRIRDLGIQPGQSAVVTFTPRTALQPNTSSSSSSSSSSSTTTTTTTPQITLNNLKRLSSADYSITLPGAVATALLTDSTTKIIQNPEIRVTDGQTAKVRIGDRVPIATGSFQAGVGVGVGGGAGVINPLVNTQFQYIDVGVNIDVTPRVHPDAEISMKLNVEVSTVTSTRNIGGIDQPVISQRKIEHDIRLKEGEASILGGLIQRTDTKALNGWPGLASIPFLHYFFSSDRREVEEDEVLIVLTPHIIRLPTITAENLQTLAAGTDTNVRVYREETGVPAAAPPKPGAVPAAPSPQQPPMPMDGGLRFEPATVEMKKGDTATVALVADDVKDLFSIPLLLQYDPAVIQIDDVRNGGFLSGGTQEIAIVQRVDQQRGQAIISATRQPNTPGVNGSGTLLGIIIRAIAPGTSKLQIVQMNARDSQQKPIPLTSKEATITVQ